MLITPVILRHTEKSNGQIDLPSQITKKVDPVVTTSITTSQTTVEQEKTTTTTTTTKTTAQAKQKSVVSNLTTTERKTTTSKSTTTVVNSETVANNTTTQKGSSTNTKKSANESYTPTEIEGYYPTEEEWNMFCVVVCSETGYCEDKAQLAVAHTVINRLSNPIYPDTIKEILTQRAQYICVQNYYTGNMRPGLEIGGDAYNHTMQLIHQAWEEWDFTNGAVAYYNPHMIGWNAWFEQYECVYEDEYGRFFKV